VIENKSGAGGNIGTQEVVRSKADGYTFVLGATNNFVINQFVLQEYGVQSAGHFVTRDQTYQRTASNFCECIGTFGVIRRIYALRESQ
jgi:hypothetical protein